MARKPRIAPGGLVCHVLNCAVARLPLFQTGGDFEAFQRVMQQAQQRHPIRILGYCLMSNHWHLVLWPAADGDLTAFVRWLTHAHTMRWHAHRQTAGTGHLYQGRFKSFPIEVDEHLLTVLRYVERNPLRARLVTRAEAWRWSSLGQRGDSQSAVALSAWPLARPAQWAAWVNQP